MEMSNDKTITETVEYSGWTIVLDVERFMAKRRFIMYPTEQGIQHDYDMVDGRNKYCGNCLWADSIEEAKELIDERNYDA